MDPDPDEHVYPGQECMKWGPGVKEEDRGSTPTARYNRVSEQARRMIADESLCSMFCGGKRCKYCTHEHWTPEQMAIKELYSAWVTDNILAMARPSNYGFEHFKILDEFEQKGIKTVINLQQPGEHASCGYGNDQSGFSYNPQRLMDRNIFFYNFAWQDYGIAPMSTLLDIVKVMQFALGEGKVAVHCHAGLGRTGLLIACYLVYNNRVKAAGAVHYVRSRRPGAIQTSQQVQTVIDFETHLKPFRTIFPSRVPNEPEVSFKHFLNRQSHMLHGFEGRRLRYIPKVVYIACERLLEIAGKGHSLIKVRSTRPNSGSSSESSHMLSSFSQITVRSENYLHPIFSPGGERSKSFENLTNQRFKKVLTKNEADRSSTDASVLCDTETGSDEGLEFIVNRENNAVADKQSSGKSNISDNKSAKDSFKNNSKATANFQTQSEEGEDDDDACIVYRKSDPDPSTVAPWSQSHSPTTEIESCVDRGVNVNSLYIGDHRGSSPIPGSSNSPDCAHTIPGSSGQKSDGESNPAKQPTKKQKKKPIRERLKNRFITLCSDSDKKNQEIMEATDESDSGIVTDGSAQKTPLPRDCMRVCEALASMENSKDVRSKVDQLETQLNETDEAWSSLAYEDDPCVLSTIIWDWLDQLKEPVIRRQDLTHLLEKSEPPMVLLKHLEKPIKYFIEYLALVLSKLFPQSDDLETRLVERLLSHLTHQVVKLNLTSFSHNPYQPVHWGEMRSSNANRLIKFFFSLVEELNRNSKASKKKSGR